MAQSCFCCVLPICRESGRQAHGIELLCHVPNIVHTANRFFAVCPILCTRQTSGFRSAGKAPILCAALYNMDPLTACVQLSVLSPILPVEAKGEGH